MKGRCYLLFFISVFTTSVFASTEQQLLLDLTNVSTTYTNTSEIYLGPGTSQGFIYPEDSRLIFDTTIPQVYSLTSDNVPCSINGYGPFTNTVVIQIGLQIPVSGIYLLSVSSANDFDPSSLILLEDRSLGTYTNLRQLSDSLQIDTTGIIQGRFYLHITYPVTISVTPSGCSNNDGAVAVLNDTSVRWSSLLLVDTGGVTIQSLSDTTGNFNFSNLSEGNYGIAFTYNGYTFVEPVYVNTHQVTVSISSSVSQARVNENVSFYSSAQNAGKYTWGFGDSSYINGVANPQYSYYETGVYTVTLQVSNEYTCTATASLSMDITNALSTGIDDLAKDSISIQVINANLIVNSNPSAGVTYTCELYDLNGRVIFSNPITSSYYTYNLSEQAAGIYLVNIRSPYSSYSRKVYVN